MLRVYELLLVLSTSPRCPAGALPRLICPDKRPGTHVDLDLAEGIKSNKIDGKQPGDGDWRLTSGLTRSADRGDGDEYSFNEKPGF
jgi:hypothetical protein